MKNNLLELLGIVLMITPSMLIGRYCLDVTSSLFWVSLFAAVPFHMVGIKLIRESK
jgi:hypothetical protein